MRKYVFRSKTLNIQILNFTYQDLAQMVALITLFGLHDIAFFIRCLEKEDLVERENSKKSPMVRERRASVWERENEEKKERKSDLRSPNTDPMIQRLRTKQKNDRTAKK